ncbi:DUF1801 domain-containing protein [Homoserinibacter sp. YIM 151385]|uniref:DUF1801 domain-containing protein n=1 Tax=Homoserinibacter sp. YIM 151385 TaxID=2985506 RepID=UPI0022F0B413|nr:DUF1801 domain-containing protein [Homoserinibacter sp. YIM 151385]WBU38109.1 DUF1801 domain-containing protein [Homoserinibacter sp. YIM 151385]
MQCGVPASTPEEYLAALADEDAAALAAVRRVIEAAAPGAVGVISYGIIVMKLEGRGLVGLSKAARHLSLHVMSAPAAAALAGELGSGRLVGATLQFTAASPLGEGDIRRVVAVRQGELAASR